jgi:hypothetical protein
MEAAVTDATAPAGWYSDFQIPNILRWWDGQTWTAHMTPAKASVSPPPAASRTPTRVHPSPARIPELVTDPSPDSRSADRERDHERRLDEELTNLLRDFAEGGAAGVAEPRGEYVDLEGQLPPLRRERDELQVELTELRSQLPPLRRERDQLLAAVSPLKAEVAELRSERQERRTLRTQLQVLQHQKSSLDRKLADLRRPVAPTDRGAPVRSQKFHDS